MSTLVFLEHHEGELAEGRARRARRRPRRSATTSPASSSARASASSPPRRARSARPRSTSRTTPRSRRRCRSRASTCSRSSSREQGFDTVLFAESVLAADVAAGLAARLDAGLNWDLVDIAREDGELVGKRPALQDSVYVDVGWTSEPRARALPLRLVRPARRAAASAEVEDVAGRAAGLLDRGARWSSRRTRRATGPSIEDADVIVAGGRGLGGAGELRARRGAREGARRRRRARRARSSTRAGTRTRRRSARPARPSRRSSTSPCGISGAIQHKVGMQGSGVDRRDQQGPERADLRVLRPRRRRRRARDRPEADRARPKQRQGLDERRPADYPPPFEPVAEAIAAPTDPPDERIDVGVLIVGAGPAGLACAIRLGQLLEEAPRDRASGSARCRSRCSRRASSPARTCSRAPSSTRARCAASSAAASASTTCRSTAPVDARVRLLPDARSARCGSRRRRR